MQVGTQQCQLSHLRSKVKKAQVQLFVILSCMETILEKHIPAPCMCLPEGHSKPFVKNGLYLVLLSVLSHSYRFNSFAK